MGIDFRGKQSLDLMSEECGDSRNQIHRYIRLTNLVPELLEFVDEGRIKMRPAVELSYLNEDCQRDLVDEIDLNDCTPVPRSGNPYAEVFRGRQADNRSDFCNYERGKAESA